MRAMLLSAHFWQGLVIGAAMMRGAWLLDAWLSPASPAVLMPPRYVEDCE